MRESGWSGFATVVFKFFTGECAGSRRAQACIIFALFGIALASCTGLYFGGRWAFDKIAAIDTNARISTDVLVDISGRIGRIEALTVDSARRADRTEDTLHEIATRQSQQGYRITVVEEEQKRRGSN